MNKRRFKKAARKAWMIAQEQRCARLTWREAKALAAYAKAHPNLVVKKWDLLKDPRPRYLRPRTKAPRPRHYRDWHPAQIYTANGQQIAINVAWDPAQDPQP